MGYKVPDWKKSIDQDKYEVETDAGMFHLPKAEYLTGAQVMLFQRADQTERGVFDALDAVAPGLGEAMINVPIKYVKEMIADWQGSSAVSLGESTASANS